MSRTANVRTELPLCTLWGVTFMAGTMSNFAAELLTHLASKSAKGASLWRVFTPNPEQLVMARADADFRRALEAAEWRIPDGIGVVWASRLLRRRGARACAERVPGVEVVEALLTASPQLTYLIIGGRDYAPPTDGVTGVSAPVTEPITLRWRDAVVSWLPGYAQVSEPTAAEEQHVQRALRALHPDVVFVALGAPSQEHWVNAHQEVLAAAGVRLVMVVGGAFDMLFGKVPRASSFWRTIHAEWLYRLLRQPWRWRRQLRLFQFSWLVCLDWVRTFFVKNA